MKISGIIIVSRLQRFFVSNQSAASLVNLWPRQPENRAAAFCVIGVMWQL